ncbi:MAG: YaaL family protein [Acetatifactor sp.]|nr:YaaL family protein [Acetatifactor sp.]
MKIFYKQSVNTILPVEEELTTLDLKDSIEKTRQALEIAYSGFNNAVEVDLIDSYIYEINALQKRYRHLTELAEEHMQTTGTLPLYAHSPIRALVSQVLG